MTDEQKMQITKISSTNDYIHPEPAPISSQQLQKDYAYKLAQQLLQSLLDCGLISLSEYNKITLLNRQTFSPFLVEIMPEIR